jgi:AraC family transcriptional regulator
MLVDRAIWQIETRRNQPLTLTALAELCAASPYHLSRSFRVATGLSPMAYLRARRLSVAAKALADNDETILSIALDAQYGSHEAFTRAFASCFGILPSSVREARSTRNLNLMEPLQMKKSLHIDVPAPEIRERPAFRVIGLGTHCTFEDVSAIPPLWQAFNSREDEVPSAAAGVAYGVCCDADDSGRFRYVAGVEPTAGAKVPAGMDSVSIPANRYAVFTHSGHISDLPKTVYTIWNKALPDAGLDPAKAPDFELYDRRFDPATGRGSVEIWIPVG